jgi:5-methylcytosine-specific restriction endonuclease McrA
MIRDRDDHLCQNPKCYKSENGSKHPVHHIDFVKVHTMSENLITLCRECHEETIHSDKDYWIDYYQNVQRMRGIV